VNAATGGSEQPLAGAGADACQTASAAWTTLNAAARAASAALS